MSWQRAPHWYHGTLAPQPNPTSSDSLRPGWPTFSAPAAGVPAQFEKEQQVLEVGTEQVTEHVEELVMRLVQGILQQVQVQALG
jgi:hypothetical protein